MRQSRRNEGDGQYPRLINAKVFPALVGEAFLLHSRGNRRDAALLRIRACIIRVYAVGEAECF
jgi:hypothetical protein